MRLIDADALIESLSINPEDCPGCPEPEWLEELADVLALAPTVDAIDRQAAIGALADYIHNVDKVMGTGHLTADDCKDAAASVFEELPSAQPEITLESAIDYLHSIGWMQEHDRTLTESAQPEIIHCESCEHWKNEHICECLSRYGTFETPKNFYCGYGKENRWMI